jgi:hypothetical protein
MKQLTKEQAIAFYNSGEWKEWSKEQIARFQLYQECLFVPFDVFHEAIENELGRPVFTHEFAFIDQLRKEYEGKKPAPTLEEIVNLIPVEKRIIIETDK